MKEEAVNALLFEQLTYYRASASEYDEGNRWLAKANAGAEWERNYQRGYADSLAAIRASAKNKDVLELAGGTGMYTQELAKMAAQVTVVDGSPESLRINQSRVNRPNVKYVLADIFLWSPIRRYDIVVFAFWLCHVPIARFDQFWRTVDQSLRDGGTVVFIDGLADDRKVVENLQGTPEIFFEERLDEEICVRRLADGRPFRIVRLLWNRPSLQARLESLGWTVNVNNQSPWLVGSASRAVSEVS